jgi:hypothetical protein
LLHLLGPDNEGAELFQVLIGQSLDLILAHCGYLVPPVVLVVPAFLSGLDECLSESLIIQAVLLGKRVEVSAFLLKNALLDFLVHWDVPHIVRSDFQFLVIVARCGRLSSRCEGSLEEL